MEFRDFSLLATDTKVAAFVEGLGRGEVLATKCSSCGALHYPPRSDCPACYGDGFEWTPIQGAGHLLTYTTVFVPPEHFAPNLCGTAPFSTFAYCPLPVGLLELENGLRVMGWLRGLAKDALRVGMRLVASAAVLDDGRATVVLEEVEET